MQTDEVDDFRQSADIEVFLEFNRLLKSSTDKEEKVISVVSDNEKDENEDGPASPTPSFTKKFDFGETMMDEDEEEEGELVVDEDEEEEELVASEEREEEIVVDNQEEEMIDVKEEEKEEEEEEVDVVTVKKEEEEEEEEAVNEEEEEEMEVDDAEQQQEQQLQRGHEVAAEGYMTDSGFGDDSEAETVRRDEMDEEDRDNGEEGSDSEEEEAAPAAPAAAPVAAPAPASAAVDDDDLYDPVRGRYRENQLRRLLRLSRVYYSARALCLKMKKDRVEHSMKKKIRVLKQRRIEYYQRYRVQERPRRNIDYCKICNKKFYCQRVRLWIRCNGCGLWVCPDCATGAQQHCAQNIV